MVLVRASRALGSAASMAMTRPRIDGLVGDVGVGGCRGGEILERRRILPRVGMESIIASRDWACVSMPIVLFLLLLDWGFCKGARVRDFSGWLCVLWGRGGGPILKGLLMLGPMKSARGRD